MMIPSQKNFGRPTFSLDLTRVTRSRDLLLRGDDQMSTPIIGSMPSFSHFHIQIPMIGAIFLATPNQVNIAT